MPVEVVVRQWTPIGTEDFEYFWSPEPDHTGEPLISWRHPDGLRGQCHVPVADALDSVFLAWILAQRTKDLEASYRLLVR